MLPLLYVVVFCCLFSSSAGIVFEEICYGSELKFPFDYSPTLYRGPLYFTPSKGGPRKLMMDNGEPKDPRMKVSFATLRLRDLRESDNGIFAAKSGSRTYDIVSLKILDCAKEVTRIYGSMYSLYARSDAEFLEFIPLYSMDNPRILWNRTDPRTYEESRGRYKGNTWDILGVTPADNGYYNLRKKDNTLLSRILLRVEENKRHHETKADARLLIRYPSVSVDVPWTVTFTPEGETEGLPLMTNGQPIKENYGISTYFTWRMSFYDDGLEIVPVKSTDSGTFEFRDPEGGLAESVEVVVVPEFTPAWVYAAIFGGIVFIVIVCFCCIRKCCCKKSSSKRDQSPPAVYYHDQNQPTGPSYSAAPASYYSHRPVNSLASRDPAAASLGPSVNIHVNPTPPEAAAPGGQGVTPAPSGNSVFSSDPEPRFELKGLTFPSAPPLSSDSTLCDVYSSDKLNFL